MLTGHFSFFFLQEDVLQLVEISDDIRRERRHRIREIEWERDHMRSAPPAPLPPPPSKSKSKYDETIVEREVIYDSRRGRYA